MKNFSLILVVAVLLGAFYLMSCDGTSDGDGSTQIQWQNETSTVSDIRWLNTDSETDQTWSGELASGESSTAKGVTATTGSGACTDSGGDPATIIVGGSQTITITSEQLNTLTISNTSKK